MTQQKDSTRQVGLARIYRSWPIIFIAAVGIYVVFKYFNNAGSLLPFIIIALCPLMHIFMHRGHGGHKSQHLPEVKADQTEPRGAEDGFHG